MTTFFATAPLEGILFEVLRIDMQNIKLLRLQITRKQTQERTVHILHNIDAVNHNNKNYTNIQIVAA